MLLPWMVTEWSFPALDSGLPCLSGAGQRFRTQEGRTKATELFAKTMLGLPFLVGYDFFMWVDQPTLGIRGNFPENSNYGLITEQGDVYTEITDMFTALQKEAVKWRMKGVPKANGGRSRQFVLADEMKRRVKGNDDILFTQDGDVYTLSNKVGLVLRGRMGGKRMIDDITLNGAHVGSYNAILNFKGKDGLLWWSEVSHVADVRFFKRDGLGILQISSRGELDKTSFSLTHELTLYGDRSSFLGELVRVANLGMDSLDVNGFYFRQYAEYATDRLEMKKELRKVPNLWDAPWRDVWVNRKTGMFFGGFSRAPTVAEFSYRVKQATSEARPDAFYAVPGDLILASGMSHEIADGTMWILCVCGTGGVPAWRRLESEN